MPGGSSDEDENEGWVDIEVEEVGIGVNLSAADIERIAEKKVREAMRQLQAKKPVAKKAVATKKVAPKKVEAEPSQPGKKSLRGFLWGEN